MFEINIWDLLASYSGDSKELLFNGEVIPGYYEDITFTQPLDFRIKLISLDDGIEVVFETLDTEVEYEWKAHSINLSQVGRTFKERFDPLAPDDIKFITKGTTIDLKDIIREEILISIY